MDKVAQNVRPLCFSFNVHFLKTSKSILHNIYLVNLASLSIRLTLGVTNVVDGRKLLITLDTPPVI